MLPLVPSTTSPSGRPLRVSVPQPCCPEPDLQPWLDWLTALDPEQPFPPPRALSPAPLQSISLQTSSRIAVMQDRVAAGFPSPATDYVENTLDIGRFLSPNPIATFLVEVGSRSLLGIGIDVGDQLIVDRSLTASHGSIVVALVNQTEFTVKRLMLDGPRPWLKAENPDFPSIVPREGDTIEIWGVVRHVIKTMLVQERHHGRPTRR